MRPLLILLIILSLGASVYFILREKPASLNPRQFMSNDEYEELQKKNDEKNTEKNTTQPSHEKYQEEDYVGKDKVGKDQEVNKDQAPSQPKIIAIPTLTPPTSKGRTAPVPNTQVTQKPAEQKSIEEKPGETKATPSPSVSPRPSEQPKPVVSSTPATAKKSVKKSGQDTEEDPNMFDAFDRVMKQIDTDRKEE